MASPVDLIHYKVNKFLYSRQTTMTFLQCGNCLIEGRVLSAEEVERHHDEIRGLYLAWKAGFDAQDGGNHQPQPMDPPRDPPIPESLAPHAALSNDSPSSPPEGTWEATDRAGLKEALSKIDPEVSHNGPPLLKIDDQVMLTCEIVAIRYARHYYSSFAWRPIPPWLSTRE